MKTLTIRNVPRRLADNSTVLDLLSRSLGVTAGEPRRNGLAELAGTWSEDDQRAFDAAIAPLEKADDEMWA
jgi:hypothetical protein